MYRDANDAFTGEAHLQEGTIMQAYTGIATTKVHVFLTALADNKGDLLFLAERAAEYAAREALLLEALEANFAQPIPPEGAPRDAYYGQREELRSDINALRGLMKENVEKAEALLCKE